MPPTVLTLFEHQSCAYKDIPALPHEADRRERILARIEQVNQQAGQEIISLGRKGLRAHALVGVLRVGDLTIEILPKIGFPTASEKHSKAHAKASVSGSPVSHSDPAYLATRSLLVMLSYAFDLPIYQQETAGVRTQAGPWFELLTRLFALQLKRQVLGGLPNSYVLREENSPVLRGHWDVQRQIRQHGSAQHTFAVAYDDLTADTPLNQVFRFTCQRLLGLSQDAENRLLLSELCRQLDPVTCLPQISDLHLEGIRFNRLNERFQPVFNLARLFLSGSSIQLAAGDLPACAFVLDMNLLFERFVAGFLTRFRSKLMPESWQEASWLVQGQGTRLYLARAAADSGSVSAKQNVIRLRPDLILTRPGDPAPLLVADTKYKTLDLRQPGLGLSPDDAYQMLAYGIRLSAPSQVPEHRSNPAPRYPVAPRCPAAPRRPAGLLLYPQPAGAAPLRQQLEIPSADMSLFAATLNLLDPLDPPQALIRELRQIFSWIAQTPPTP